MLDINGDSAGTVQQSFPTTPGNAYSLNLHYSNNPRTPPRAAKFWSVNQHILGDGGPSIQENVTHHGATPDNMEWQSFSGSFVADGPLTTLRLQSLQTGSAGIYFDTISVVSDKPQAISINRSRGIYVQDFDADLGPDGGATGASLPAGWRTHADRQIDTNITAAFPQVEVDNQTYNVGQPFGGTDRTLATGSTNRLQQNALELAAEIANHDMRACECNSTSKLGEPKQKPLRPEERLLYSVTLDIWQDNWFRPLVELNDGEPITTGKTLSSGFLDGNRAENRTSLDRGIVETDVPQSAFTSVLYFNGSDQGDTAGYIYGLDNLILRTLPPGDANGDGVVDQRDIVQLLARDRYGVGVADVVWEEGDFDHDDDFDQMDIVAVLGKRSVFDRPLCRHDGSRRILCRTWERATCPSPKPPGVILLVLGASAFVAFQRQIGPWRR